MKPDTQLLQEAAIVLGLLVACAPEGRAVAPPATGAVGERAIQAAAIAADASRRYASGLDPSGDDAGRAAYRSACLEHQIDRELVLDELHERAQIHAFAWRDWYERHCVALAPPDGTVVAIAESGASAPVARLCPTDAGAPPARAYERSDEERLAQRQRDACERAQ